MFRGPYARLRMSCRLCISAAVCSMRKNGTRNAGISSSGSVAIGAVLISPGAPVVRRALTAPMLTATTQVQDPEDIPTDECATGGEARLTHQGKNHPRSRDPDGHVSEASGQGEHSREHLVRIEGEEAQTGPSPGLHSRNEPKIQREHELAEGLRELAATRKRAPGALQLQSQWPVEASRERRRMRRRHRAPRRAGTRRSVPSRRRGVYRLARWAESRQTGAGLSPS